MNIELIKYIKQYGLNKLEKEHSINIRRHEKYKNLVLLKYSQIDSDMSEKIVQQCRGIILDEADDWKIVNYAFNKFGNIGESYVPEIDWKTAKIQDKLDGTCICMWNYNNKWQISTLGSPNASGQVNDFNFTFAELFWSVWNEAKYSPPKDENCCYAFELLTPYNRVVVQHKMNGIILHCVRNLSDLLEREPELIVEENGWKCVKNYPLRTLDDVVKVANERNPLEHEGFVVVDGRFNRIKVKSNAYVNLSHLKDGLTKRRLLDIIRSGEGSEILSYFPEFKNLHDEVKEKYDELLNKIEQDYEKYKGIEDRKEFALSIKHLRHSSILFSMRAGKTKSIKECLANIHIKTLENLVGINEA